MLSRIFLAVAGMSANAGLLVLAILAVRLVTRRRMPKWGNCLLWGLVAVCLMCPVLPESVLSVRPQPGQAALPAAAAIGTASPGAGITLTDLAWVWLVGMAAVLGWAAVSYLRLRRQVAASIRVGKQVYLCDDISSPFILGIFRPRVYLPSGLEGETLKSVLRHEGAHLRRRDHWWKPLGHLLVAIYWFHPLIWAAYVLLCRDIELACDERVVRDMNRAQRAAYSQALLDCAMPRRRRLVLCPLAFGEVGVRDRVKSVLHYRRRGVAVGGGGAAVRRAGHDLSHGAKARPDRGIPGGRFRSDGPRPSAGGQLQGPDRLLHPGPRRPADQLHGAADGGAGGLDRPEAVVRRGQLRRRGDLLPRGGVLLSADGRAPSAVLRVGPCRPTHGPGVPASGHGHPIQ